MSIIKVFVIDDSATVRQAITKIIETEKDIELLGVASDPILAMKKFKSLGRPDVLILDIEMPKMDGITFLKQIMSENPIATIICSSVAKIGNAQATEVLSAGALTLIEKPNLQTREFFESSKNTILQSIRDASHSKFGKRHTKKTETTTVTPNIATPIKKASKSKSSYHHNNNKVIAIGSSTGGVVVIEKILTSLPAKTSPILIVQHMPAGFTNSLANRLDNICKIKIKEAKDGEKIENSTAYIARGDKHLTIQKTSSEYIIKISDGPKISHHRPSIDVLFRSFKTAVGANTVGIILTGMGSDGAHAMKELHDIGAKTYAQDEESCVVFGMPNEAIKLGGVTQVLSIDKIIEVIEHN